MQMTQTPPTRRRRKISRKRLRRRFLLGGVAGLVLLLSGVIFTVQRGGEEVPANKKRVMPTDVTVPEWVTQDFLEVNPYSRPGTALEMVNGVVVHYIGNPGTTAAQNLSYFRGLQETGEAYASSHFIIGLEGEILQCVPLDEISYCSNSRNVDTIAIEVCHPDEIGEFTEASYDSLIRLLAWLCNTYSLDPEKEILRHGDVFDKMCPIYYMQNPDAWRKILTDTAART